MESTVATSARYAFETNESDHLVFHMTLGNSIVRLTMATNLIISNRKIETVKNFKCQNCNEKYVPTL